MTNERPVRVGHFIEIPAWHVIGCVLRVEGPSPLGSGKSITVLLQEHPDDETGRRYRLEPDEYVITDYGDDDEPASPPAEGMNT